MHLIKKFKQNATLLISPTPSSLLDWLFIMQHYGVPTRLLDWTESPLVASYFACNTHLDEDGAIWIIRPVELNKIGGIAPEYSNDIPSFEDKLISNYTPESLASERTSKLSPVAAIIPRNNSRMQAQLGVFTISHRDDKPIEQLGKKNHIGKYVIPKEHKKEMVEDLRIIGFGKFQLFPELPSIGEVLQGEK